MANSIREIGENIKNSQFFKGSVSFDEPLSAHTTMKVGGAAALFIEPADTSSAAAVFGLCRTQGIPVFTLGGGSNLVVSDEGFDGAVVSSGKMNSVEIQFVPGDADSFLAQENKELADGLPPYKSVPLVSGIEPCVVEVSCGAGAKMDDIAACCAKFGILGLEHFAGLPGTAGGGAYMNARCYEKNMSDVLASVEYIDAGKLTGVEKNCSPTTYVMNQADWSYKHSPFQKMNAFITRVQFRGLCLDDRICFPDKEADSLLQQFVQNYNNHFVQDRTAKGHFRAPSAGSVFKNNHDFGKPSGKLVDEAGLKGFSVGGAQIAPWHGNFIINTGNATAADIHSLVVLAQQKVKERTGFLLEPEIIFCGKGYENSL